MTGRRHPGRAAWLAGAGVLLAVGVALWSLFGRGRPVDPSTLRGQLGAAPAAPAVPRLDTGPGGAAANGGAHARTVAGIVRLPDGGPAAGASVTLYRATTAWPEWRRELLDRATTGADGTFRFGVDLRLDLLLGFEHPASAGGLEEVPALRDAVDLRLLPGFALSGLVTNDAGSPLANVRVAAESVLADRRRAAWVATGPDGRYRFTNLPAGPVRLVARHPQWQPATAPAVVVGAVSVHDLAFDRPALPPLRGRVVAAAGQAPIAGATVEVLPPAGKAGFADVVAARTGDDGAFELTGLARGNAQVLVRHPEHGAVRRTLALGATAAELVFELPGRSAVGGQLLLDGGSRADWSGTVLHVVDAAGELAHAAADPAGRFEFPARLSPGWATLALVGSDLCFQRSLAAEVQVRIEERAATSVELVLVPATRVRGRIVDGDGRPLAGATVRRTRQLAENARWISDAAVAFDVGAFGSQVAQLVGRDRDLLLAVAGADGSFEVRGLEPGPLLARFDLPGRGSRWLRLAVPPQGAGDFGDVVMPAACRLRGRVLRGSSPLAGASVTVSGAEALCTAVTSGDGGFTVADLPPGAYRVRARLPSMPTANAEADVTLAGELTELGPLVLQAGRTLRGTVLGSDGQPVPAALVTVRGAAGQPTLTDPGGRFALELPDRATVELQVSLGDRSRRAVVPVRREQAEVDVRLDTPPSCTLVAQVAGLPGRQRLPGVLLRLLPLDGGEAGDRSRWVEMQGGELRWPLCPVGRVRVQIVGQGYAPWTAERDLVANEEHQLGEVLLEPGGVLQGRVVDPAGAPVANACVLVGEEADLDLFEPQVRSGPDGSFRIGGITTGASSLVVRAPGLAPRTVELRLPQDVLAEPPLVIALEPGSAIVVEVGPGRAREGGLVQLRRRGRVIATAELDEAGRAVFLHRSPGSYTVQLYGSDEPPKPARVESAGQQVRVQL